MPINWVDITILCITAYYIYSGWERGFIIIISELVSFLISLWLALRLRAPAAQIISEKLGLIPTWSSIAAYILIAFVSEGILAELFAIAVSRLPKKILSSEVNAVLGSIVSLVNGAVIIAFFLLIIMALPLRGTIKNDIAASQLAGFLLKYAQMYGGELPSSIEGAAKRVISFVTIEPGSNERIPLDLPEALSLSVDAGDETSMVELVNKERTSRGLKALVVDSRITVLARKKSTDMFMRRYFSHYDPDGKTAADHMEAAGVPFTFVGENLAYAPDLMSAHNGLMNSEGHRANILNPKFSRIGIGIIDSKYYGKMFTQQFAN